MEIEDFFKIYQRSAWNKNSAAMIDLYDKQAVVFDMWDQGYLVNSSEWAAKIQNWLDFLGGERVKVNFEMIKNHRF